jgi:thiosulfate dehydrogenase [quinone] large subunit
MDTAVRYLLAGIRIGLGWIFLWAFLDKVFGLGYATTSAKAWLNGGSPTNGFLGAAKGPFSGIYHSIAGTGVADVLFMAALLAIGTALLLGIAMRLAAVGGALLTVMMWTAVLPPASNPFLDDHLIYAAVLVVLALLKAGNTLGLGRAWAATPLVRRASWLR